MATTFVWNLHRQIETNAKQLDFLSEVTTSIYTMTITTKENTFRSTMKRVREMLLNKTRDASTLDRNTLSGILWYAVLDRDIKSVRELINYNPDVNYVRSEMSMLWMAIIRSDIEMAKMLIEAGADVNQRIFVNGPSYLHFLVSMGDDKDSMELAQLMVKHGADVNAFVAGCSVLRTAVMYAALPFVELLLKHGAYFKPRNLILLAAQSAKSSELLPMIVNSIGDAKIRVEWIFDAFQYLIMKKTYKINAMKAILSLDLPVLDLEIQGWTILNIAVHFGKIEVVKLVLDHGADVKKKSVDGNFPLFWAVSCEDSSIAELLIKCGANVHEHNDIDRYAIHNACRNQSEKNIDLLLRFCADINVTDKDGATPFSLMADEIFSESHKLMIKQLATLASSAVHVNDCDLEKIRENPDMLAYYDECLRELQKQ